MAASAFQRLLRVLELEERQGWRNRAVIGGLQAMAARWQKDAAQEEADPQIVAAVVVLMARYQAATLETRIEVAATMRSVLAGESIPADVANDPDAEPVAQSGDNPTQGNNRSAGTDEQASPLSPSNDKTTGDQSTAGQSTAKELMMLPPPEPTHLARERVRRQQAASRRSAEDLLSPVTILPGVGASTAELLARLGIEHVVDLIWHLPSRHDDFSQHRTIAKMEPGESVTVIANLWEVRERKISMKRQLVEAVLSDGTGTLHAHWWNKYVRNQLRSGTTMRFSGKVGLYMGRKT